MLQEAREHLASPEVETLRGAAAGTRQVLQWAKEGWDVHKRAKPTTNARLEKMFVESTSNSETSPTKRQFMQKYSARMFSRKT